MTSALSHCFAALLWKMILKIYPGPGVYEKKCITLVPYQFAILNTEAVSNDI